MRRWREPEGKARRRRLPRPYPEPRGKRRALARIRRAAARAEAAATDGGDPGAGFPEARAAVPDVWAGASVSETVAALLFESIEEVAAARERCSKDPSRDFTRVRKLPLEMVLATLVCWAQDTVGADLYGLMGWEASTPTASAFRQQWAKLSDEAMPLLMRTFMGKFAALPYLGRYRLLAADGTGLRVPETGEEATRVRSNQGAAYHDELHPTCSYDPVRHTYEDVVFQGAKKSNEPAALCELVDRAYAGRSPDGSPLRALWVADRNYFTMNVACHMAEAGAAFVIRATDDRVFSFLGYEPVGEFDVTATRYLTRSWSVRGRSRPRDGHLYRVVRSRTPLDVLAPGKAGEYAITLRVVRVAVRPGDGGADSGDRWMNLVTNLPADEFPPALLEQTYLYRWREETSYLHLKHTIGARLQHTRDYSMLCQEVLGRMVLYNACSLGTSGVPRPRTGSGPDGGGRATDVTMAFKSMMALLRGEDADVEGVAARHTHATGDARRNPRRKRAPRPVCFKYRC